MGPCGWGLVHRRALHQPALHNAEYGLADHLRVAAPWGAPTHERELLTRLIPAGELQQRGVHLALPLPLLPQPDPIPCNGVGADVCLQRVGIAEDGGSPHIDPLLPWCLLTMVITACSFPARLPQGGGTVAHRAVRAPLVGRPACGVEEP